MSLNLLMPSMLKGTSGSNVCSSPSLSTRNSVSLEIRYSAQQGITKIINRLLRISPTPNTQR